MSRKTTGAILTNKAFNKPHKSSGSMEAGVAFAACAGS